MDKEKLIAGVVGGIVAGFSIGVGFMIAQKTMGKFFHKKAKSDNTEVADAVAKGVTEGVKQAKVEDDAKKYSNMTAGRGGRRNPRAQMEQSGAFMGFDGNPASMGFNSDPTTFKSSPNGGLNNF